VVLIKKVLHINLDDGVYFPLLFVRKQKKKVIFEKKNSVFLRRRSRRRSERQ
jgi:hypothetical protein